MKIKNTGIELFRRGSKGARNIKWILLQVFILTFCLQSQSQNNPIQFEQLTPGDGLSQGHILCMIQDSEGYIWAGTFYGLNRYNGYNFDVFYANKKDTNSMLIDMASSLCEDSDGNIWVGTWGISIFNKKTEKFRNFLPQESGGTVSYGGISAFAEDARKNMWIGTTGGGLDKYDYQTKKINRYFRADTTKIGALKSDYVNGLLIDRNQRLWIATEDGLSRMNLDDESITTYRYDSKDPHSIPSDQVSCVFEDKEGNIWTGDAEGNLNLYNPVRDNFTSFSFLQEKYNYRNIRITKIAQDWQGNLLVATNGAGLIIFNNKTGETSVNQYNSNNPNSIASNEISSLLVDKNNTVFVGTFGRGISKFSHFNRKFETHYIPGAVHYNGDINSFTDAAEDKSGNLIVGTYYGFVVFNQKTWEFKHYLPGDSYEDNKILTVTIGPDESIWFGTMRRLHRYDKHFHKIRSYLFDENLKDHSIYTIKFDYENNLWIGLFTKALLKITESVWRDTTREKLDFKTYLTDENNPGTISGNQVWIIYPARDSSLWFGTNRGVCYYNYKSDDFTRVFDTGLGAVKKIKMDSKGILWMGTIGNGIYSYNLKTNTYHQYTTKDGLCHNFVYGLIIDKHDNLWISTESGLSRFNQDSETFRNFDERDGLPDNHFDDASDSKLSNGRLYFGTNHGFIIFNPDNIVEDTSETKVVLTGLKINNRTFKYYRHAEKDSLIDIPVGQISDIELTPNQRDFSLEFAALHYVAPHKIKYAYKLEGYDNAWIYTDAANRIARYTNLDGGNYTFQVRSTNADGRWTNKPLTISIKVIPPFYKTILFRFLVLAFIIFLTFLAFRWRIALEISQKKVLTRKVDERTSEITSKNEQLKKTADDLTQLNEILKERQHEIETKTEEIASQRDELEKINATKDKLFAIIAHDLKNPFNVILGYTDVLVHNFDQWTDSQKLEMLNVVKDSSANAYNLLENLLNWSRSQRNTLGFEPEVADVNGCIRMMMQEVVSFATKKGVILENKFNGSNLTVYADINMLMLICRNLLMNAIKFSNTGNTVSIDATGIEKNFVRFSISDQGIGMKKEKIETLFNPEKNVSTKGTQGEAGTGLGLVLCKDFVTRLNGEIWVESRVNIGTTFYFTVPQPNQKK